MNERSLRNVLAAVLSLAPIFALSGQTAKPPGTLVDLDGYAMHIWCTGEGSPTVVLFAGAGDYSFDWELIQKPLSRNTRVCSYDRPGYAWSSIGPVPRTMLQEAAEVRQTLSKVGVRAPYILVGHSLGGLIIREYTHRHPADVAGLVMVDPTHEDVQLMYQGKIVRVRESARNIPIPGPHTYAASPPKPPTAEQQKEFADYVAFIGAPKIKPPFDRLSSQSQTLRVWALSTLRPIPGEEYWAEELAAIAARRKNRELGDLPLAIVLPMQPPFPAEMSAEERAVFEEKTRQKEGLLSLSARSELLRADSTSHHVHLHQPDVVLTAIHRVLARARKQ